MYLNLNSEDYNKTNRKKNIPLASTTAINNILKAYLKHVNSFLYLARYHDKYKHLHKELAIDHVDEEKDLFLDEVENFSIDTYEEREGNIKIENLSIQYHLSKIILFLSNLIKNHYNFWDSEMIQVIHEHIVQFKYLKSYFQKNKID